MQFKTEEEAFYAGLQDGVREYENHSKVAEAFFEGLKDGVEAANHVPIMDKIAQRLDMGTEEVEVEAEPASASDRLRDMIRGN